MMNFNFKEKSDERLGIELLVFFLSASLILLLFYFFRNFIGNYKFIYIVNRYIYTKLFLAYYIDLVTILVVLIPYILIILYLILKSFLYKRKISDNVLVILFFPLLSFFTKSMSLPRVYVEKNIFLLLIKIFYYNYPFFLFIFIGPGLIFLHKIYIYIKNKRINNIGK